MVRNVHCVSEKKGIPSHKDEEGPISGLGLQLEPSLRFRLRLGFSFRKVGYRVREAQSLRVMSL